MCRVCGLLKILALPPPAPPLLSLSLALKIFFFNIYISYICKNFTSDNCSNAIFFFFKVGSKAGVEPSIGLGLRALNQHQR